MYISTCIYVLSEFSVSLFIFAKYIPVHACTNVYTLSASHEKATPLYMYLEKEIGFKVKILVVDNRVTQCLWIC